MNINVSIEGEIGVLGEEDGSDRSRIPCQAYTRKNESITLRWQSVIFIKNQVNERLINMFFYSNEKKCLLPTLISRCNRGKCCRTCGPFSSVLKPVFSINKYFYFFVCLI